MDRFMARPETDREKLDRLNAAIRVHRDNIRVTQSATFRAVQEKCLADATRQLQEIMDGLIR